MFNLLTSILCAIFKVLFTKRKDLIFTLIVLKKENQIYKRQLNQKKVHNSITWSDRFFLTVIYNLSRRAINHLNIVKPSTLLRLQRNFIKKFWTFQYKSSGRKPIANDIKKLILQMKQGNSLWGCHRIADELKKIGIELNPTTVNRIIQNFRKQGKIQPTGSWKRFLKSHWDSLYGMDFMAIDTLLGKRFYLLTILELRSQNLFVLI